MLKNDAEKLLGDLKKGNIEHFDLVDWCNVRKLFSEDFVTEELVVSEDRQSGGVYADKQMVLRHSRWSVEDTLEKLREKKII